MGEPDVLLRLGPVVIEIGRWVYGTVILMTVLVVYADEGQVTFAESFGVVVAPMLATFLAHLFASVLAALNRKTGGLNSREFAELVRNDAQYLVLTVPPLSVLLVGALGAFDAPTAVSLIVRGGVALLVVIGALAGLRAGFGPWGVAASATASAAIGLLVLGAQLLLK
ncbi:MAG: hypothetical protein ACRDRM_11670 [Pseudonocardiaceae bacterium]